MLNQVHVCVISRPGWWTCRCILVYCIDQLWFGSRRELWL